MIRGKQRAVDPNSVERARLKKYEQGRRMTKATAAVKQAEMTLLESGNEETSTKAEKLFGKQSLSGQTYNLCQKQRSASLISLPNLISIPLSLDLLRRIDGSKNSISLVSIALWKIEKSI
ncbi:hypothetical protein BJV82DRAFT_672756 [Fennellomyces sp. T-0311]|nr:hypothetical protein BJV82DRAFT_672756 [Fennellomyces sp. T-0311]